MQPSRTEIEMIVARRLKKRPNSASTRVMPPTNVLSTPNTPNQRCDADSSGAAKSWP